MPRNTPADTPRVNHNLTLADSFKLMTLLTAEYTESKMTDSDFAVYAADKLGAKVNKAHVYNRRNSLGIPSNRVVATAEKRAAGSGKVINRIEMLEQQVHDLLERVKHLESPFPVLRKGV